MPRYDAKRIEAKWQSYWDEHGTFVTSNEPQGTAGKLYVLDMFPYPSGDGLHVGHPEGYTATDIVSRFARMRGRHVLHPMGWDAFGLPAEQHAIKTGTHPRETTQKNIDTFRRQLKMLGFSYDWSREIATTDEGYYRWTQWIFLQLYDTWYDPEYEWTGPDGVIRVGKGRPISELPIPEHLTRQPASGGRQSPDASASAAVSHGPSGVGSGSERQEHRGADAPRSPGDAVRRYQDQHRLAYQSDAPVNWCPALGTVLANEEVTAEGRSDRGNHPVERRKLRQWMLRITAYAERLLTELDDLDWTESIKLLQRNWIGKSLGAEVDFYVGAESSVASQQIEFDHWKEGRKQVGFPREPGDLVLRVYTTRPDTLFGATYMVVAPEHPIVERITTEEQKEKVDAYREAVSRKSDLDRTDLAKEKTGVFSGAYAINPVNGEPIPIWIADYVLISYGTGAIMAVPAHDERDLEFARTFDLPVKEVVEPPESHGKLPVGFSGEGTAINSGKYTGLLTAQFKQQIAADLAEGGLGRASTNYRLRDWLFSRQRYWGEPFPLWHELDADGKPTGLTRPVPVDQLPVTLPEMADFQPKGTPDPPLGSAPDEWLYATADDGTRLKRETNSMPQWAGSCWYYLRFADGQNDAAFIDPAVEKYWLPVDLYIGGAEHAVLHLLYSRFWHKVLFDRGHVSSPEPFAKLVNQGMILGEPELTGYRTVPAAGGDGVYDAATLKPLLQAHGHIEKVGALAVDHFQGSLAERWPHYAHLESEGKTCLYSALRQGVFKVSTDRTEPAIIDQHPAFQTVRETIGRCEPDVPTDQDPIRWWNNEKGLDATLRMLDAAVASLTEAPPSEWVSVEQVSEAADGQLIDSQGVSVEEVKLSDADVVRTEGRLVLQSHPHVAVRSQAHKMSKSRGNVINPDDVVLQYGADSLRLYEMFMGPLEQVKPWSMSGVEGVSRFLGRAWRMIVDERADALQLSAAVQDVPPTEAQDRVLHKTIQSVTDDVEKLSFNTAISRLMEFTNEFTRADVRPRAAMESFVLLLSPFAPHIAEELWQLLGHDESLAYTPWPTFDDSKVTEETIEIPVQVNGKLRAKITVPAGAAATEMEAVAQSSADVQSYLAGKTIVKVIAVPGRMVNFVVKG